MLRLALQGFPLLLFLVVQGCVPPEAPEMVRVPGGSFLMGDVLGEGEPNELPVHLVHLGDFFLAPREVTVQEFERFVAETGYRTSAEGPFDPEAHGAIMARAASGELSGEEMQDLHEEILRY